MSEYQFFEFKSISKPLTPKEIETISSWSRRTQATSSGAIFTYQYSDFPKDEMIVVEEYFDAMFHTSNWGITRLIFKIPKDVVDITKVKQYRIEGLEIYEYDSFILIDIIWDEQDTDFEWIESNGILSSLIPLRDDIISGDYRCLYLMWLKFSTESLINNFIGIDENILEPELPSGLNELSSPLLRLIDVFCIDRDTIAAAAAISEPITDEKIKKQIGSQQSQPKQTIKRTNNDIAAASMSIKKYREREAKKAQLEKFHERMFQIELEEESIWENVYYSIAQRKPKHYDEAVKLLVKLKELAIFQNELPAFNLKIEEIKKQNSTLSGLKTRMESARL